MKTLNIILTKEQITKYTNSKTFFYTVSDSKAKCYNVCVKVYVQLKDKSMLKIGEYNQNTASYKGEKEMAAYVVYSIFKFKKFNGYSIDNKGVKIIGIY